MLNVFAFAFFGFSLKLAEEENNDGMDEISTENKRKNDFSCDVTHKQVILLLRLLNISFSPPKKPLLDTKITDWPILLYLSRS